MARLFIFGIGGTGSRVLKSLTMLMAAGVKVEDVNAQPYEIVPIIIDPDHAAADLTRTVELMRDYSNVYKNIDHNSEVKNHFFRNKINMEVIPSVQMPLDKTSNVTFRDYVKLSLMRDSQNMLNPNYALTSILFSSKNLQSTMEVGFKGNPNIGSVVLNQFTNTDEWKQFVASFGQNDRIFIISSIFGGTGASGFPLLLKNIRAVNDQMAGCQNVRNSVIGAVTVLPYFDVKQSEDSEIDSSTFISKTKAALTYYVNNINEANVMYYIGDNMTNQYENSEGGTTQRNKAHFIELAAALAIVDFANQPDLNTNNGVPQRTLYKEFGIRDDVEQIIFGNLDTSTNRIIKKPLVEFTLFCKYMREQIEDSLSQPWAKELKYDSNFIRGTFYDYYLKHVREAYMEWLDEMSNNVRAFTPFNLGPRKDDLFSFVRGIKPVKLFCIDSNYALFDAYLNKKQGKIAKDSPKENQFVELFYLAISELVDKKLNIK